MELELFGAISFCKVATLTIPFFYCFSSPKAGNSFFSPPPLFGQSRKKHSKKPRSTSQRRKSKEFHQKSEEKKIKVGHSVINQAQCCSLFCLGNMQVTQLLSKLLEHWSFSRALVQGLANPSCNCLWPQWHPKSHRSPRLGVLSRKAEFSYGICVREELSVI